MDRSKQVGLSDAELTEKQKYYALQLERAEQRVVDLKKMLSRLGVKTKSTDKVEDATSQLAILANSQLSTDELYELGEHIMGREPFRQWLQNHNPALGVRPMELLKNSEDVQTLKEELLRIDYGLFS
jgi:hypothetical protein